MTLPRTVAEVLSDHVVFEVECIDRMYLNVYVPQLQYAGGLLGYVQRQLGLPIASTAPLARITDRFTAAVLGFPSYRGDIAYKEERRWSHAGSSIRISGRARCGWSWRPGSRSRRSPGSSG